jgi:hypothetical protein
LLGLFDVGGLWATPERHEHDAQLVARAAGARSRGLLLGAEPSGSPPGTSGHPRPVQTESEPFGGRHVA